MQAGTLMHELGHNLDLSHAGWSTTPNCMPNYPSVMSYLYQTRGLTDANGVEQIDYSNGLLARLNENSISSTSPLGFLTYRVRFYGPLNAEPIPWGQAAQLHCDGTPITDGARKFVSEGPAISTPDWSNGLYPAGTAFPLDVNFDGITGRDAFRSARLVQSEPLADRGPDEFWFVIHREPGDGCREPRDGRGEPGDGCREPGDGRRELGDGCREPGDGRRKSGDGCRESGDGCR